MTSLDLADNISALVAAICYQNYITVEEAFQLVEDKKVIFEGKKILFSPSEQDKEDMYNLRERGLTYPAIGQIYGIDYNRVFKIIKNYKIKKETLQGGNLCKVNV